jgi:hypothetical protein
MPKRRPNLRLICYSKNQDIRCVSSFFFPSKITSWNSIEHSFDTLSAFCTCNLNAVTHISPLMNDQIQPNTCTKSQTFRGWNGTYHYFYPNTLGRHSCNFVAASELNPPKHNDALHEWPSYSSLITLSEGCRS